MSAIELAPEYLAATARQYGFLGAFLGGVAATFCATMLTLAKPSRSARWSIGLSSVAAVAFIVVAILSVTIVARNHPLAPELIGERSTVFQQAILVLSFTIGGFALLSAIGVAGWTRSKPLGIVTSSAALIAAIPIFLTLFF